MALVQQEDPHGGGAAAEIHEDEVNFDDLSFQKRWELVGSPTRQNQQPESSPRSLSFVSMHSSQRLTCAANELLHPSKGAVQFPASIRRIEPGSPLRLLDPAAAASAQQQNYFSSAASEGPQPARKNPLTYVTKGMQALHSSSGPDALVQQRRRARHGELASREAALLSRSKPALLLDLGGDPYSIGSSTSAFGARSSPSLGGGASEDALAGNGNAVGSAGARRIKAHAGRAWALREFREWSSHRYGGVEQAVAALGCFKGGARIKAEPFATALAGAGYPMGKMGGKNLFNFVDTDEDGLISQSDAVSAAGKMTVTRFVNKMALLQAEVDSILASQDVDTIEAHVISSTAGLGASGATRAAKMHQHRDKILAQISEKEPLLGDFLKYLFTCFNTLKAAFRHMDVNQNDTLSRSEFNESLRTIRSKEGVRFIDAHLDGLYAGLSAEAGGSLSAGALLRASESGDPLLRRFGTFLEDGLRGNKAPPEAPADLRTFEEMFGRGFVSQQSFRAVVDELRYIEWLLNELFIRIDIDGSGNITVNELTCFLEPEPPRPRPASFAPKLPPGSEKRLSQLFGLRCMSAESPKLAKCGIRKARLDIPESPVCRTNWKTEQSGHALCYQRPVDPIDAIRDALETNRSRRSRSSSDLEVAGRHSLKGSPDPVPDLTPPASCAVARFDLDVPRTRLTSGA